MEYVNVIGDTAVIHVPKQFNLINTSFVKAELDEAYKKGASKVTVDFQNTVRIDSSAVRDLALIYNRVKSDNFKIINLVSDEVYKVLSSARLDELWNLVPPAE